MNSQNKLNVFLKLKIIFVYDLQKSKLFQETNWSLLNINE